MLPDDGRKEKALALWQDSTFGLTTLLMSRGTADGRVDQVRKTISPTVASPQRQRSEGAATGRLRGLIRSARRSEGPCNVEGGRE